MNRFFLVFLFFISVLVVEAQDTVYARSVIKKLTSKKFLGRGYVNNAVNKAAHYLKKEFKEIGLDPFNASFSQTYRFDVNSFPNKIDVVIDGKKLKAGEHFLIDPTSQAINSNFKLIRKDSLTFVSANEGKEIELRLKKKLTYTVATSLKNKVVVELLKDSFMSELKEINVEFKNKFIRDFESQNIAGYVKGIEQPDSFLVFSAHYDHLGAMGKTAYFPGANDNASGVSMLLNLAKYYQKNPSKYSVAFLLFSGEEAGLLGSKYYTEHPLFPLKEIKFLTNLDLLGTGEDGIMVVNASVYKSQFEKLVSVNNQKKYVSQIKQRGKAANSDHYWFSEKGVPCFFIYTLGGITSYHDVYDIEKTLPLTDYYDVGKLLIDFNNTL
jgi:aminopeptidase YwaD